MNDEEIKLFAERAKQGDLIWIDALGFLHEVMGYKENYKEPWEELAEPVALLRNGKVIALYNTSFDEFYAIKEAF